MLSSASFRLRLYVCSYCPDADCQRALPKGIQDTRWRMTRTRPGAQKLQCPPVEHAIGIAYKTAFPTVLANSRIADSALRARGRPMRCATTREMSQVLLATGLRSGTNSCALPSAPKAKIDSRDSLYRLHLVNNTEYRRKMPQWVTGNRYGAFL